MCLLKLFRTTGTAGGFSTTKACRSHRVARLAFPFCQFYYFEKFFLFAFTLPFIFSSFIPIVGLYHSYTPSYLRHSRFYIKYFILPSDCAHTIFRAAVQVCPVHALTSGSSVFFRYALLPTPPVHPRIAFLSARPSIHFVSFPVYRLETDDSFFAVAAAYILSVPHAWP